MNIIGFTGTSSGMDLFQKEQLKKILLELKPGYVLHGMCKGADTEFHYLVRELLPNCIITGCPGYSSKTGSSFDHIETDVDYKDERKPYFERNRNIVNNCELLLATPYNDNEQGGTWYTINYAKKVNVNVLIIKR